jgi:NapC/NirT cytochrome c family, N-terminal region/Cytochrome c7 and related cytochrome c
MEPRQRPPLLVLMTSHWVSMLGVALVTLAGCSWLFVLPVHLRGHVDNPYIGLLIFVAIPMFFFLGLILIPIGIALAHRRVRSELALIDDRRTGWRRVAIFFGVMTVVNVLIGSQVTYRAVEHMETVQFCGQSCHVMQPEFTAHQQAPHQQVACIGCHVVPGAAGWVKSKLAGTRQLKGVLLNSFPRPIESAMASDRLVPSAETCEQCHAREKFAAPRMRVLTKYKDDEANTRTETVLMMRIGGGSYGGIHGVHLGPGVHVRYRAADKKRQEIPWVEYRNSNTGVTQTYVSGAPTTAALVTFEMQCVDCHNRPAHAFEVPDRAVDGAIESGQLPSSLPFIKKMGVELIKGDYVSSAEAELKIASGLASFYRDKYPEQVRAAGEALVAIYKRNVFPDLKVRWGTYPNNLGHTDYPGCFRCHDDSHTTADKKTITQDCAACHQALAVEEESPEILKTIGVKFQKQ